MREVWEILSQYPIYGFYMLTSIFCALSCGYFLAQWQMLPCSLEYREDDEEKPTELEKHEKVQDDPNTQRRQKPSSKRQDNLKYSRVQEVDEAYEEDKEPVIRPQPIRKQAGSSSPGKPKSGIKVLAQEDVNLPSSKQQQQREMIQPKSPVKVAPKQQVPQEADLNQTKDKSKKKNKKNKQSDQRQVEQQQTTVKDSLAVSQVVDDGWTVVASNKRKQD